MKWWGNVRVSDDEFQRRLQARVAERVARRRRTPYFVYRQFDADDCLLYVGCTFNPHKRELQHKQTPWIHLVTRTEYEMHPNTWVAEAHESFYIATEHPLYNVDHSPDRTAAIARRSELAATS